MADKLVFELHGMALRLIAYHTNIHYHGLRAAGTYLRRRHRIPTALARKMARVDDAFAIVRHITSTSVALFIEELDSYLATPYTSTSWSTSPSPPDSSEPRYLQDEAECSHAASGTAAHASASALAVGLAVPQGDAVCSPSEPAAHACAPVAIQFFDIFDTSAEASTQTEVGLDNSVIVADPADILNIDIHNAFDSLSVSLRARCVDVDNLLDEPLPPRPPRAVDLSALPPRDLDAELDVCYSQLLTFGTAAFQCMYRLRHAAFTADAIAHDTFSDFSFAASCEVEIPASPDDVDSREDDIVLTNILLVQHTAAFADHGINLSRYMARAAIADWVLSLRQPASPFTRWFDNFQRDILVLDIITIIDGFAEADFG